VFGLEAQFRINSDTATVSETQQTKFKIVHGASSSRDVATTVSWIVRDAKIHVPFLPQTVRKRFSLSIPGHFAQK
jgi:hypothetical protein